MQSIDVQAIQKFLELVKRASQARSREIRIEITDATMMAAEFGVLIGHLASRDKPPAQPDTAKMDAGFFK